MTAFTESTRNVLWGFIGLFAASSYALSVASYSGCISSPQQVPIEIRNHVPGHYEAIHEMRPCTDTESPDELCPHDWYKWHEGHFQWRHANKYSNPEEGWKDNVGALKPSNTGYSYFTHINGTCIKDEATKNEIMRNTEPDIYDTFHVA